LSLGVEERETLERWARRPKSAQALGPTLAHCPGMRHGSPNTVVADQLGVTYQTVGKWRNGSWSGGWQVLLDERGQAPAPSGATRRLSGWCA